LIFINTICKIITKYIKEEYVICCTRALPPSLHRELPFSHFIESATPFFPFSHMDTKAARWLLRGPGLLHLKGPGLRHGPGRAAVLARRGDRGRAAATAALSSPFSTAWGPGAVTVRRAGYCGWGPSAAHEHGYNYTQTMLWRDCSGCVSSAGAAHAAPAAERCRLPAHTAAACRPQRADIAADNSLISQRAHAVRRLKTDSEAAAEGRTSMQERRREERPRRAEEQVRTAHMTREAPAPPAPAT